MNEKRERDYSAEYETDRKRDRVYRVRVPIELSKRLDEKLKKENKQYSTLAREAIEKYLEK